MAGQQLYQLVMTVPGLTGTWQQRNAQLYKALGSPMGAYKGNLQQNLYLLDQIKKKNYGSLTPPAAPAAQATPTSLARQYTDPLTGQLANAAEIPQYENAMPFYDAWGRMVPQATIAAESQINPESLRNYNSAYGQYMSGMTSAGGQRFGRALGEIGNIKATAERDRLSQLQDWLNAYQTGYKDLFYNPSRDAWNTARTQANFDSKQYQIPTWNDVYQKYNTAYGVQGAQTPQAGFVGGSPFYPSKQQPGLAQQLTTQPTQPGVNMPPQGLYDGGNPDSPYWYPTPSADGIAPSYLIPKDSVNQYGLPNPVNF